VITGTGDATGVVIVSNNAITVDGSALATTAVNGLTLAGAGAITATVGPSALKIDASAATGKLILTGNKATATITGGSGADFIISGGATATITGGAGADTIIGGAGSDNITGGLGADTMTGGDGADVFAFGSTEATGLSGGDTITDFLSAIDKLQMLGVNGALKVAVAGNAFVTTTTTANYGGATTTPDGSVISITNSGTAYSAADVAGLFATAQTASKFLDSSSSSHFLLVEVGSANTVIWNIQNTATLGVAEAEVTKLVTLTGTTTFAFGDLSAAA
jgi:hypothetical protein